MNEKKYLIFGIIMVLIVTFGLTYAYFSANIEGNKKVINVNWADLKIIFTNGDAITGENIKPGWNLKIVLVWKIKLEIFTNMILL